MPALARLPILAVSWPTSPLLSPCPQHPCSLLAHITLAVSWPTASLLSPRPQHPCCLLAHSTLAVSWPTSPLLYQHYPQTHAQASMPACQCLPGFSPTPACLQATSSLQSLSFPPSPSSPHEDPASIGTSSCPTPATQPNVFRLYLI